MFGVLFRGAKNCPAAETIDAPTLAGFLRRGLNDLKRKSPATVGDKTMMDALVPAVEALEAKQEDSLAFALESATAAAKKGAESTVGMVARFGRATALGERVRAAQDPGATSIFPLSGIADGRRSKSRQLASKPKPNQQKTDEIHISQILPRACSRCDAPGFPTGRLRRIESG